MGDLDLHKTALLTAITALAALAIACMDDAGASATSPTEITEESAVGTFRCRANPGPKSIIGETMLRAPKPMP